MNKSKLLLWVSVVICLVTTTTAGKRKWKKSEKDLRRRRETYNEAVWLDANQSTSSDDGDDDETDTDSEVEEKMKNLQFDAPQQTEPLNLSITPSVSENDADEPTPTTSSIIGRIQDSHELDNTLGQNPIGEHTFVIRNKTDPPTTNTVTTFSEVVVPLRGGDGSRVIIASTITTYKGTSSEGQLTPEHIKVLRKSLDRSLGHICRAVYSQLHNEQENTVNELLPELGAEIFTVFGPDIDPLPRLPVPDNKAVFVSNRPGINLEIRNFPENETTDIQSNSINQDFSINLKKAFQDAIEISAMPAVTDKYQELQDAIMEALKTLEQSNATSQNEPVVEKESKFESQKSGLLSSDNSMYENISSDEDFYPTVQGRNSPILYVNKTVNNTKERKEAEWRKERFDTLMKERIDSIDRAIIRYNSVRIMESENNVRLEELQRSNSIAEPCSSGWKPASKVENKSETENPPEKLPSPPHAWITQITQQINDERRRQHLVVEGPTTCPPGWNATDDLWTTETVPPTNEQIRYGSEDGAVGGGMEEHNKEEHTQEERTHKTECKCHSCINQLIWDTLGRAPPTNILARRRVERIWEERRDEEEAMRHSFPYLRRWDTVNLTDININSVEADMLSSIERFEDYFDDVFYPDANAE